MKTNELTTQQEVIDQLIKDRKTRVHLAKQNHFWFFNVYFRDYVKYQTADFQKELFAITENNDIKLAVIVAFRGSAKSTLMTLSYPIWSIIGCQQRKFVIIISQTQHQAKLHLANLKRELESNDLLRLELGPFEEKHDEWGSTSLVLPKFNARITAASSEQSVRGLRHGPHRPDLIICDDVENLSSVKTREGRDKTYNWLTGEVIPAGDVNTKVIIVGNLLHKDSLLMRLKEDIEKEKLAGIFKAYPLMRGDQMLWPGKFINAIDIGNLKKTVGNEIAWQREFMLHIVPNVGQIIHEEWIHRYDAIVERPEHYLGTATGIDLAITKKDTADYTAMVSAKIFIQNGNLRIYILPNPVNERLHFPETIRRIKSLISVIGYGDIYVEDVAYQASVPQQLQDEGIYAQGAKVNGQDKAARLALTSALIQSGKILFPLKGAERLIEQILNFGVDKHDDLVDAFTLLILKICERGYSMPEVIAL